MSAKYYCPKSCKLHDKCPWSGEVELNSDPESGEYLNFCPFFRSNLTGLEDSPLVSALKEAGADVKVVSFQNPHEMRLKRIDLSKIRFEERPRCKQFCLHDDISLGQSYLANVNGRWNVVRFKETWFGYTSWNGFMWRQLSYHYKDGWKTPFQELYALP